MTFLPEPARRDRHALVISADDHLVEPPDTFARHMPARFAERAPRVVTKDDGTETWLYDGVEIPNIGLNAVAGKPPREYSRDPVTFADMVDERVRAQRWTREHGVDIPAVTGWSWPG